MILDVRIGWYNGYERNKVTMTCAVAALLNVTNFIKGFPDCSAWCNLAAQAELRQSLSVLSLPFSQQDLVHTSTIRLPLIFSPHITWNGWQLTLTDPCWSSSFHVHLTHRCLSVCGVRWLPWLLRHLHMYLSPGFSCWLLGLTSRFTVDCHAPVPQKKQYSLQH